MLDVTQLYCPASGGKPGEDNTTHHLQPRAAGQTCRYCGKTEKQLRDAGGVGVTTHQEPRQ